MGVVASWIAMMLVPPAPVPANHPEIACYTVEAHVLREGQEIAAPTMRVATGGLSTIVDTEAGFAMIASVTPRGDRSSLKLGAELYVAKNDAWLLAAKPVVRAEPDQLIEQRFAEHGVAPVTVQLRITPVESFNAVAAKYIKMMATSTVSVGWKATMGAPVSAGLRFLGPKMEGC